MRVDNMPQPPSDGDSRCRMYSDGIVKTRRRVQPGFSWYPRGEGEGRGGKTDGSRRGGKKKENAGGEIKPWGGKTHD